jgi:DNA-binding LytR/AlgR family response regulator
VLYLTVKQSMTYTCLIIDDNEDSVRNTREVISRFPNLALLGVGTTYESGLDLVLELNPNVVFLEIEPNNQQSKLSLGLVNELYRYLFKMPEIIVTAKSTTFAFDALKFGAFDYLVQPFNNNDLRKSILRLLKKITINDTSSDFIIPELPAAVSAPELTKEDANEDYANAEVSEQEEGMQTTDISTEQVQPNKPLIICVKSYGDYRFIEAKDICYLQADNNSTDIHLHNGEMITAFKTLKHFEGVLSSPFVRIHNSYIVNIDYVSRIHTGNSVCYIKNTTIKLPFSKSYKENVDAMINSITTGNYLEI